MSKKLGILILCILGFFLFAEEQSESSFQMVLQTGSSFGIAGYSKLESGDTGSTTIIETEYFPGFILNNLELGLGFKASPQLYIAFMPGVWFNMDFSRYAVTTVSAYGKYAFTHGNTAPICTLQAGLFLEDFPESPMALVLNPTLGVEFKRSSEHPIYLTLGYLLTYMKKEDTDPGNSDYLNNEEEQRHSISLNFGVAL